uniref:TPT domain-containing protein n=1 Tax=Heterorhabditis bacteriophora TaxID=37862 RepID=A0A1I7X3B4_HETBA
MIETSLLRRLDSSVPYKIFPLPLLYVLNLVSGLGGTQMIKVNASRAVRIAVMLMISGSVIAAIYDLAFDLQGYILIIINDICTAALGVYTKQKLDAKDLGKYGLMFYNCLFMSFPSFFLISYMGDMDKVL